MGWNVNRLYALAANGNKTSKAWARDGKRRNFSNAATYEKLLADYDQLQLDYKDQGGYQYEADIRAILSGLGFPVETHQTTISTLSGGQKHD